MFNARPAHCSVNQAEVIRMTEKWQKIGFNLPKHLEHAADPEELEAGVQRVLVDLRNIYRPEDVRAAGFEYSSIGRG